MTPSSARKKQVGMKPVVTPAVRDAIGVEQYPDRRGQVVNIESLWREVAGNLPTEKRWISENRATPFHGCRLPPFSVRPWCDSQKEVAVAHMFDFVPPAH